MTTLSKQLSDKSIKALGTNQRPLTPTLLNRHLQLSRSRLD
jgi:hypothetical protein